MPIPSLTIIGESINDSVPSTQKLFEQNNLDAVVELAKIQDQAGAAYIDVNIGRRSPELMADLVKRIQKATAKPLSIDSPDYEIAKAGLEAFNQDRTSGKQPILNSISPLRTNMLELYYIQPFMPILMVSERLENDDSKPNRTARETCETAKALLATTPKTGLGLSIKDCIIDVGIAPIASDSEGMLKRVVNSLALLCEDPMFKDAHRSLGLSNFTVMLPPKTADGIPVRSSLENAFLTIAMPLGLDMIIGSTKRNYEILDAAHPAVVCLKEVMQRQGFDAITRLMEFYT